MNKPKQNKYELVQPVFFNSKLNPNKTPIDINQPVNQINSNPPQQIK